MPHDLSMSKNSASILKHVQECDTAPCSCMHGFSWGFGSGEVCGWRGGSYFLALLLTDFA